MLPHDLRCEIEVIKLFDKSNLSDNFLCYFFIVLETMLDWEMLGLEAVKFFSAADIVLQRSSGCWRKARESLPSASLVSR